MVFVALCPRSFVTVHATVPAWLLFCAARFMVALAPRIDWPLTVRLSDDAPAGNSRVRVWLAPVFGVQTIVTVTGAPSTSYPSQVTGG